MLITDSIAAVETYLVHAFNLHSRRRRLLAAMACAFALSLSGAWLASQIVGFPRPMVHDEFCYLLAGETFASGRLAMPTHPMAYFFETLHQIQWPAYVAKYPPGQGLVLAAGFLLGDPIYGVWICVGALSASFVWMLGGFGRVRWAFLGGLAGGIWFGSFSYWGQSFWGGALTATGAAILWGATRRLHVRPTVAAALALGCGVAILFLSRPFDGLLACIVPGILLARRLARSWREGGLMRDVARLAVGLVPLCAAFGFQMACNHAATGSATRMAYTEYREQYDRNPVFVWEAPREAATFNHPRMEAFDYLVQESATRFPSPFVSALSDRLTGFGYFYTAGVVALLLVFVVLVPARWVLIASAAIITTLLSTVLVYAFYFHYLAASAAPLVVVVMALFRWIWLRFPLRRDLTVPATLLIFSLLLMGRQSGFAPLKPIVEHGGFREAITEKLADEPGQHLALVVYERGVHPHVEYVFNTAHIDSQKIIWARWTDDAGKRGLFDYYRDRRLWLVTVRKKGEPRLREFQWQPDAPPVQPAPPASQTE
jgi:hypothetical protein